MIARLGLSRLGASMIVSGAFGLFRSDAVIEVDGYSLGTVGEELELVVKLHKHFRESGRPCAMRFLAEPIAWTQAPESLGDLGRQRSRWQRGALETYRKHRPMSLNRRYGAVGLIDFGQLLAVDAIGAPVTVMGYVLAPLFRVTGLLSDDHFLAYVAMVFSLGILISVLSLILEQILLARIVRARDLAALAAIAVVENFGYRQLCNWWRIVGWYQFLREKKGWGRLQPQELRRA